MRKRHRQNKKYVSRLLAFAMALFVLNHASAQTAAQPDIAMSFSHSIPLHATGSGSFSVTGTLAGIESEFLVDTGASMVTVSRDLFDKIHKANATKVKTVAARLASGKLQTMDVYLVENFVLGDACDLGAIEVAVLKNGGRNLLGMSVLSQAAPLSITISPPALGLSQCDSSLVAGL